MKKEKKLKETSNEVISKDIKAEKPEEKKTEEKNQDIFQVEDADSAADKLADEKIKKRKRIKRKKVGRVIDRIFGFILASLIMIGLGCLGLEYVIIKGPSPALSDTFSMTMLETRRFSFIPHIFLTDDDINSLYERKYSKLNMEFDPSLINVNKDGEGNGEDEEDSKPTYLGIEDEDGDGYTLQEVKRKNFMGYLITIMDPNRVFIGMPDFYGGNGMLLEQYVEKYGAIGGINGGGYLDPSGTGMGGIPNGLTIIDGVCYNEGYFDGDCFVGFDQSGVLHVGYYSLNDAVGMGIRDGVTFGPILVMNGIISDSDALSSGVNPRTAIGQRADGAVLMLCIDGRQAHSVGCTYADMADIMLDYGAINAINLDGGSSSAMYLNGEYINSSSAGIGSSRLLPNAFLFK